MKRVAYCLIVATGVAITARYIIKLTRSYLKHYVGLMYSIEPYRFSTLLGHPDVLDDSKIIPEKAIIQGLEICGENYVVIYDWDSKEFRGYTHGDGISSEYEPTITFTFDGPIRAVSGLYGKVMYNLQFLESNQYMYNGRDGFIECFPGYNLYRMVSLRNKSLGNTAIQFIWIKSNPRSLQSLSVTALVRHHIFTKLSGIMYNST